MWNCQALDVYSAKSIVMHYHTLIWNQLNAGYVYVNVSDVVEELGVICSSAASRFRQHADHIKGGWGVDG